MAPPFVAVGATQSSLISAPIRLVATKLVGGSVAPNVVSDSTELGLLSPLTLIVLTR